MPPLDMLSTWSTMTALERMSVREVYFRGRTLADTAHRCRTGIDDVSRALQSAYRRVAAFVLDPAAGDLPAQFGRPAGVLPNVAELPVATWRWDTSAAAMTWSTGLYGLFGYRADAVSPTIGLAHAHTHAEDRAGVERLVLTGAAETGPVVFAQRILRTDGSTCRVVSRVTREPGSAEVLTGRVVADLVAC